MPSNETLSDSEPSYQAHNPLPHHTHRTDSPNNNTRNPYHTNPNYQTRQELHTWLQQARRGAATTAPPIPDPKPRSVQKPLKPTPDNPWWGDPFSSTVPPHTLRIVSKNVNSLNTQEDYLEWKATAAAAKDLQAGVLCLQEPNLRWNYGITSRIKSIFRQMIKHHVHIATSNSSDPAQDPEDKSNYQPGGTMISALGPWTSCVITSGTNSTGLGRWSFIEIEGKTGKKLIILSGYRACPQKPRLGSNTYSDQQYRLLLQAGHANPDPREQFIMDIIAQIHTWRTTGHDVLLCMDVNEPVTTTNRKSGIGRLITEMDLVDLQQSRILYDTRPPTYNRGPSTIDIILGNPELLPHITAMVLMPFGIPENLSGDHRTVIIDFDSRSLLGNCQQLPPFTQYRGVNSHAQPTVHKFCRLVTKAYDNNPIFADIRTLENKDKFTSEDHTLMDEIDRALTYILVKADKKCRKLNQYPWSPALHKAYLIHRYWKLKQSAVGTERNYDETYQRIRAVVGDEALVQGPNENLNIKIRQARNTLRMIRRDAINKRKQFLIDLGAAAKNSKNKDQQKLILGLKQAEENRRCFAMVRQILKPKTGGLTHLLHRNPDNDQLETINDRATMEMLLLQRSQEHFKQAHGTPYMVEPLCSLLGTDGLTPFGQQILNREPIDPDLPITEGARLLLENQYNKIPKLRNTEHALEFEPLMKGLKKWPERMATSPSGRHLGVYKSLLKDQHHEKQGEPITTKGVDIMMEIYRLLTLAVKHTHTFERWKTVWNLYLEKDPGRLCIDRLRTLHIVEADYNLLLKWHLSLGFMARAEEAESLLDNQSGGHAGRSAIDLACQKISLFEIYCMIW